MTPMLSSLYAMKPAATTCSSTTSVQFVPLAGAFASTFPEAAALASAFGSSVAMVCAIPLRPLVAQFNSGRNLNEAGRVRRAQRSSAPQVI